MSIAAARIQLVSAQPFYGAILQNCLFSWNEAVGTAAVGVDSKGRVNLVVAPSFWDKLSEEHRVGLLMHEMLHLLMDHNVGAKRSEGMDHKLANIAEDIAINQFIPNELLPPGALLPSQFGFPTGLAFEEYYLQLLEKQNSGGAEGGNEPLDNHEFEPGDGPSEGDGGDGLYGEGGPSKEIEGEATREVIRKAIEQTGIGNVPNHVKSMLPDLEAKQAKIRWSSYLRKYMGRHLSNETHSTRNRPNRRLGFKAQGRARDEAPKAIFGFDESGSMSDQELQEIANEARQILKALADKTEVVHFDTEIAHIEKLSKITTITRHADGGTDFTPLVKLANARGVDLLVILSDGDGPMRVKPNMPVIWILPEKRPIRHKGEIISLK